MKYNYIDDGHYALTDIIEPDEFGFFEQNPLSQHDLINICGGVPSRHVEFLILQAKPLSTYSISIEIETNLYDCARTVDFKEMEMDNNGLYVYKPGNWIGTTLFLNQVKEARRLGFRSIGVVAEGPDRNHKYTGHYKWGRVGFQMSKFDLTDFHIWVSGIKRGENSLGELLLSEEGCRKWKIGGFTWTGRFYLHDDSECMNYLLDYLERENISYHF